MRTWKMNLSGFLVSWFVLTGALASTPPLIAHDVDKAVTKLFGVVKERFDLQEQVAAYKWENKVPIEDLPREKILLEEAANEASKYELDKAFLVSFVQAQMNAAKQIQKNHFERWKAAGLHGFDETTDLVKVLRPKLDKLRAPLLSQLAEVYKLSERSDLRELINTKAKEILMSSIVDENVVKTVTEPLLGIRIKTLVREQTP